MEKLVLILILILVPLSSMGMRRVVRSDDLQALSQDTPVECHHGKPNINSSTTAALPIATPNNKPVDVFQSSLIEASCGLSTSALESQDLKEQIFERESERFQGPCYGPTDLRQIAAMVQKNQTARLPRVRPAAQSFNYKNSNNVTRTVGFNP